MRWGCCGCSLRTGSLIVGYFYLVSSMAGGIVYLTFSLDADIKQAQRTAHVSTSALSFTVAVLTVLLLIGIHGKIRLLSIPWLVIDFIMWCYSLVAAIFVHSSTALTSADLAYIVAALVLDAYAWLIVLSFCLSLSKSVPTPVVTELPLVAITDV